MKSNLLNVLFGKIMIGIMALYIAKLLNDLPLLRAGFFYFVVAIQAFHF